MGHCENDDNDSVSAIKNVLVFMVHQWTLMKWNLNCFGFERVNLLIQALEMLHDTLHVYSHAHVYSVTFDSAICNQSMCNKLGVNFQY